MPSPRPSAPWPTCWARPVTHFAFPFGGPGDFDDTSVEVVRAAGFDTACTTVPGTAWPATDRYRLPRRLVMDWGRARFRAQMQRWKLAVTGGGAAGAVASATCPDPMHNRRVAMVGGSLSPLAWAASRRTSSRWPGAWWRSAWI